MRIGPYLHGDARLVRARDHDDIIDLVEQQAVAGPAFTVVAGVVPIGCGGVVIIWPGVGEAWALASERIAEYPMITRLTKKILATIMHEGGLHRIGAWALVEQPRNQRWLQALGFVEEGISKHYLTDRRDVIRYGLVRGV